MDSAAGSAADSAAGSAEVRTCFFCFHVQRLWLVVLAVAPKRGRLLLLLFLVVALPFLLTSVCSFTYSDFQECTPQHGTAAVL